jgi:hypothetical protein
MRELSISEKFLYVVKRVLTSPFSLALWAVGGVVSYWMQSWLPLGAAALGQAVLTFRYLRDEEFLRNVFLQRQQREENLSEQQIESLLETMDFETRQRIRYILQLQKELAREARSKDNESYTQKDLDRIASQLTPLVQRAVRIAQKRQQLSRYLTNVDERALKNYCTTLKQKIETTTDQVAKAQYERALQAREAELQTYQAIAQALARIDSQLENVEATFASWKAKVIRIKTADVASAATVREGLYQELDHLSSEIDLLDTSVSEALAGEEEISLRQQT